MDSRPFRLSSGRQTVFIDPFGDMSEMAAARGLQFEYPPIEGVAADLVLVTHEHLDHNAVEAIGGSPPVLRSTAGRLESPVGEVVGVNSEHDEKAGTERGPNAPPIRPGRRGPDDRRRAGGSDLRAPQSALGRADALPLAADRLPGDRKGVRVADAGGRAARLSAVRDFRTSAGSDAANGGASGALGPSGRVAQLRRASQLNPRTASAIPSSAQAAITPSALMLAASDVPLTIAPDNPEIRW